MANSKDANVPVESRYMTPGRWNAPGSSTVTILLQLQARGACDEVKPLGPLSPRDHAGRAGGPYYSLKRLLHLEYIRHD